MCYIYTNTLYSICYFGTVRWHMVTIFGMFPAYVSVVFSRTGSGSSMYIYASVLPPLSKNFRNLPLVGHANRPHMRRGHGGAYLSYGKVRQTYRGAPCRISGSGDRRKGARGRIPRGHSCAFCVSSLYLTSPKTIEMTDWAPVWEMYMEFSIYRLDYISSVYTHARWTSKRGPRRSRYNSTVWGPRL